MATASEPCSSKNVSDVPSQSTDDSLESGTQQSGDRLSVGTSFSSFAEFHHALDELKKDGHPFRVFNSQSGKNYKL